MEKLILDPCSGSRMMWRDKKNPLVVFGDIRNEQHILCDGRLLSISPDYIFDAQNLPFDNEQFYHIVLDLPHLKRLGINSWMAKKYGVLLPTWKTDIKGIFDESWRTLKTYGTLVFKWNTDQVTYDTLIEIIQMQPMYTHMMGKGGKTLWMNFFKDTPE